MRGERAMRRIIGQVLAAHATFLALSIWEPGWSLTALDRKFNLPAELQALLLGALAFLAVHLFWLETRLLRRTGQSRGWALSWLAMAGLFAYIALDEAILIHQRVNTEEYQARLGPTASLQALVVWLLLYAPAIVGAVVVLVASLGARRRLSARFAAWGAAALTIWMLTLMLEGTAKSFFVPRDLFRVEVLIKETLETIAGVLWGWALWQYRRDLQHWLTTPAPLAARVTFPWRLVVAGTLAALTVPAGVIAASIALNPQARQKALGDQHLYAGRNDDAAHAYRAAVAVAPRWARAWDRLGIAEFRRGELEAADRAFATAESLNPRSPVATNHRGAILFRQGRYDEAAATFARAIAIDASDADAHRNLGFALRRLGRTTDAEGAFRRAEALGLSRVTVTAVRVSVPADLPLAYVVHRELAAGLAASRSGRVDAGLAEYRRVLSTAQDLGPAHLALANELLRAHVARRLSGSLAPVRVIEVAMEPVRPLILFTHWVQQPDGRWESTESTVDDTAVTEAAAASTLREAREHYQRAVALGIRAPAYLGLGLLAGEDGNAAEAESQFASARAVDSTLPRS